MPEVQEGNILLFTRRGTITEMTPDFEFVQIRDVLTQEERNRTNSEGDDFTSNNLWMGLVIDQQVWCAMGQHQCIGILDKSLNRIGTIDYPYATHAYGDNNEVSCLAFDQVARILYVSTVLDPDIGNPIGVAISRASISAYHVDNNIWLWRAVSVVETTQSTINGMSAFDGVTMQIALSVDRTKLYFTDTGYGVGVLQLLDVGGVSAPTPFVYVDAIQPTFWDDVINWSRPLTVAGGSYFPDETKLVFQPGPPHQFVLLDDGSSFPWGQGDLGSGRPTEGNLLNTRIFRGYFDPPANTMDEIVDAQVTTGTNFVAVGPDGRVYTSISQNGANQFSQVNDLPFSSAFFAIMQSNYSGEAHVDIFESSGSLVAHVRHPYPSTWQTVTRTGYVSASGFTFFVNQARSIAVDRENVYAWGLQIASGEGPLTRIKLADNTIEYRTIVGDVIPQWAIQELNSHPEDDTAVFVESLFLSPAYAFPAYFEPLVIVKYPGIARVPKIGTTQDLFVRTTP